MRACNIYPLGQMHCLMGHGMVGVTASLAIKYRKPVAIKKDLSLSTEVVKKHLGGTLVDLCCEVVQERKKVITATGTFFIVEEE